MAGRNRFPPAWKIWSAAAWSSGLLCPTTFFRFTVSWSMSALTGARISDEDTVADRPCPSASKAKLVAGTALFSTCDSLEDTSLIPLLPLLLRCEDEDTSSFAASTQASTQVFNTRPLS